MIPRTSRSALGMGLAILFLGLAVAGLCQAAVTLDKQPEPKTPMMLTYSADGRYVAYTEPGERFREDKVYLKDLKADTTQTIDSKQLPVMAMAFSADGKHLAISSLHLGIEVWDVPAAKLTQRLYISRYGVDSLAFSPDGKMLAAGAGNDVHLYDISDRQAKAIFHGHEGDVRRLAFSPDNRTLAAGDENGDIRIYDVAAEKLTSTLRPGAAVRALAYSPDGNKLAIGGADHVIKLYEVASGKQLAAFHGHHSAITSLAFHPTGRLLASAAVDGAVKVWNVATGMSLQTVNRHGPAVVLAYPEGLLVGDSHPHVVGLRVPPVPES